MPAPWKELAKDWRTAQDAFESCKEQDPFQFSNSDILTIDRIVKKITPSTPVKVAYLSNFTLDLLPSYVNVFSICSSFTCREYIGGYDQYFQEVVDEKSQLIAFDPDFIVLALSLRKLSPPIYYSFNSLDGETKQNLKKKILATIIDWTENALKHTKANLLVSNILTPTHLQGGVADLKQDYGETEFYSELNLDLLRAFKHEKRVFLLDINALSGGLTRENIADSKMLYLAEVEWSEKFFPIISEAIIRYIRAIGSPAKKCLVLDCDNTLWGGVVGEEGVDGIKVGQDDPTSKAYYDFQMRILNLKNRGIALALSSKNNIEDVLEVFEKRQDMPLKKEDFAVMQINWDSKDESLKKISQSLNIGTDSLIFVDDNPSECSLIGQMLPDVKTILLPKDPAEFANYLFSFHEFERGMITHEDSKKTVQYQENLLREERREKVGNLQDYLASLQTEIAIWEAEEGNLVRVHQLFTKTNQFNLTTIRYTMADIEMFCKSDKHDLSIIGASDQFGSLGIIGLYLIEFRDNETFRIDSFILSCRVIGRGIESAIMNHIKMKYFDQSELSNGSLEALYRPTNKNKPAENFYASQNFEKTDAVGDEGTHYQISKNDSCLVDCGWIKVTTKKEYDGGKN